MLERTKHEVVGPEVIAEVNNFRALELPTLVLGLIVSIMLFSAGSPPARAEAKMMVLAAAAQYEVPPALALGISKVETRHRCGLTGKAGEKGPMQILPSTAKHMGFHNIRSATCATQVEAGMAYLKYCLEEANGNQRRAAACYNAGPRALTWSTLPERVSAYVQKVFH